MAVQKQDLVLMKKYLSVKRIIEICDRINKSFLAVILPFGLVVVAKGPNLSLNTCIITLKFV
jgi:hypothetical protein